jgi:3-oxoacyl-[acyl-carrier protein] reductase
MVALGRCDLPLDTHMLSGKIAVITGASRGIGLATARKFAEQGATVLMLGRNDETLSSGMDQITHDFPSCKVGKLIADVSQPDQVRDAFQKIHREYGALNVLVANAGILEDALIGMVSQAQLQRVFATNTFGFIYCAQYAARLMSKGNGGSMVCVSSIIGTNGNVGQAVYGGSKAAVIGIAKSLAKELAPKNIRVNAVAPGLIDTDMARSLPPEKYQERLGSVAMGRPGSAEDVANVIAFLASDLSSYVTGQALGVDGGMLV